MVRGSSEDPSLLMTASLGAGLVATALATASLLLGTDLEVTTAIILGTLSLTCAIAPILGFGIRTCSLGLAWTWTLGGPLFVFLSATLHRPYIALVSIGPFLALALSGRREAVTMAGVAFGCCFMTFVSHIVLGPGVSGQLFQSEIDTAIGLILAGAAITMGHAAATSRSQLLISTRSTAASHARWLSAVTETMLQVDHRGHVMAARWVPPFNAPAHWKGVYLGDLLPELRGLIGPLLLSAEREDDRLHIRLERTQTIDAEVRSRPGPGNTVILLLRDVTREREAERLDREVERQRAQGASQTQLLQAGRLAHMGVLAFGVAHEVNNPLAYVMSNLQYIEDGLDNGEPIESLKEALHDASDGARRIRSIVEDIRMFAKADDSDHLELVQLAEVARSAVRLLRFELRQRVRLVEEHKEAPPVFSNPSRLAQGILNLLVNAVQSMPPDREGVGSIILRTGTTSAGEAFIEVQDDGVGIPTENQRRVFEPFFTTRPIGQGTGLGLSICYGLVRRLGGHVDVQSEVGNGSTFRIRLPNGQKLLDA